MVRKCAGLTILELVIVFSLLLTLLVLVALYFVRGQQYIADIEAYSAIHREASATLRQMTTQLAKSTDRQLVAFTQEDPDDDPSHIYFLSFVSNNPADPYIRFDGPTNQVVWRKWVSFFHAPEKRQILRADIALSSPEYDLATKPSPNVNYSSFLSAKPKSIGRNITQLEFLVSDEIVTINLTAETLSPVPNRLEKDKIIEIKLYSQVTLTN